MKKAALLVIFCSFALHAQEYTRGIGVYPGDPKEYTGPSLVSDTTAYRNLALHRPAYQSSAYDYNLTAQLVTDGLTESELPQWIETSTSTRGSLAKNEREVFLDGNVVSSIDIAGEAPWVEFDIQGGGRIPEIDRIDLYLRNIYGPFLTGSWTYTVLGSDDRTNWKEVGRVSGSKWPDRRAGGPSFAQSIPFSGPAHFRSYRVQLAAAKLRNWAVAELAVFDKGEPVSVAGPEIFTSAWMSAGSGEEWVYVDLGVSSTFDRIELNWIRGAQDGAIQVSDDASQWKDLARLTPGNDRNEEIKLAQPARGRYVRVLMTKPAHPGDHYVLSEFEVYGRGGLVPVAHATPASQGDRALSLAGGNWRVQRASLVAADGEQLSEPGFADRDWIIATVPGTVLTSYLNDGAIPDPDFGDNQYAISDSFFCADFWYRDEFTAPALQHRDEHTWLNFDGINWKAEIYLNGHKVGRIDGGFMRGRFDVTALVHPGATNALAVRIIRVANPGSTKDKAEATLNGGALGRDNPTFHASIGWDWISTIRGRDTGIWSNVSLTTTGPAKIEDPLVTTTLPLPDTTHADVTITATVRNLESKPVTGTLKATFGDVSVEAPVTLDAASSKIVEFSPANYPVLHLTNPRLWWPVGYGEPNLYPVSISLVVDDTVSDKTSFNAGVRQFTYSEDGAVLKIWINGRRFVARGGNWGFSESMLRYRARHAVTVLGYHRVHPPLSKEYPFNEAVLSATPAALASARWLNSFRLRSLASGCGESTA